MTRSSAPATPDPLTRGVSAAAPVKSLLNLGCGSDTHPDFVNIDLVAGPGVIGHDLRKGIPFPDATFDLVYHSTMLSHLRTSDALRLTRECFRVLRQGGVLRIVTEDLEQMCLVYLQKLEAAYNGDRQAAHDYDWMFLELYDQATRERPGGGMADYMTQNPLPNEDFVYSRVGVQGRRMVAGAQARLRRGDHRTGSADERPPSGWKARIRELMINALLGENAARALEIGRFRLSSGQISYRMYDRFSLRRLFLSAGFSNVSTRTAAESGYAFWKTVNLDRSSDGQAARPHALIMEGVRAS